jgi:hypothetical protein
VKNHASTKVDHIMKEILSLAKMDATLALALLDKSLVPKTHANKHAIMKAAHMMKEIHSLAKMDVIPALALLDRCIVLKTLALTHVDIIANMKVAIQ